MAEEKSGHRLHQAATPSSFSSNAVRVSSGIDPFFALAFARHILDGERLIEINPLIETELKWLDDVARTRLRQSGEMARSVI